MIFEIYSSEGDAYIHVFKDRETWVNAEKENIEGTVWEDDIGGYINQFMNRPHEGDILQWEGRMLIEGNLLVPQIKERIKEIDL